MIKVRWLKILRELWGNKARTILVVLSIAVGVFAVGTITNSWLVLVNDLNTAYLATNPASATLSISRFNDDLVSAVESKRSVAQAEGRRSVIVKLRTSDGETVNLNLDAVDEFSELSISQMTPEDGVWPPGRRQLLVERSWLEELDLEIGQTVQIEMPDGQDYELELAGTAHDLHVPSAGNTEIVAGYVTIDTLQWLGEERYYNKLYLTVAENELDEDHISSVVTDVKEQVIERSGFTVTSVSIPTPGEAFLTVIIRAILIVLAVVGAFSLLLSGALVVNTVSAVIARQMKQIGVMKAIGGNRAQITEVYMISVLVYGLLSVGVAIPLAVLGTKGFTSIFAGVGNFDILTTGLPPVVILLEILVGLLVPVIAAYIPVRYGTRITVREAISSYGLAEGDGQKNIIDRISSNLRGFPSSVLLALRNTFRRKTRLGLTLGTLTLAGAIFIAVLSVRDSLFLSFDEALVYYQYDLSVDMAGEYRVSRLEREAEQIPGVADAESWLQATGARIRPDGSESTNYQMIGVPPDTSFLSPELVEGRWVRPEDRLSLVVNTDFVREEEGLAVGDTLTLTINGEEQDWMVVGIVTKQYSTPLMYVGYEDLARATNRIGLANRVMISLSERGEDVQAQVATTLEDRFKKVGLLVGPITTRSDFVDTFEMRFNFLTVFLLFLAVLLAFVGGLGLAGTMSLNVLERVREIGVMRAVGASNWIVQRVIVSEGLVIGVMSWMLAAVVTLPLSKLLSDGVGLAFGGEPLTFQFSLIGLIMWLVLALVIAALSSYLPARRASKLSVREVLNYE